MAAAKDSTLRLMIVDDSGEQAEAVVSGVRNGGIAVRPLRPLSGDELQQQLQTSPLDLILATRTARQVPISEVLAKVAASGKDIPVIVLHDTLDEAAVIEVANRGARNFGLRGRNVHLLSTLEAEWEDLETRRALRRLEAQLRETERRCDALIASSRDPIAYIHEGMHIRANDAYLEMFGFESFEDVEGISLLDLVAPQHVADFKTLLKQLSKGESPPPLHQLQARSLDGDVFPATMEFATASYEGEQCVQVVFRRREFDADLAREVEDLRQRDVATGLLNRPTFLQELEDAVARVGRGETPCGLLLIEPDHFARLLPELGLHAADTLMAALAARLSVALAPDMRASRFGEHSFAVLSPGDHARTDALAQTVRDAFASHVLEVGERALSLTVSIGGVQIGEKIASVSQVLAKASENLQNIASAGGNAVRIFDPGSTDREEEERIQRLLDLIRKGLAGEGFALHFQPIIPLMGEHGDFYESLLRLESAGETHTPNTFLGLAEQHDLLGPIDRWVIQRAIALLGERERAGKPTRLLVKVSPPSFSDPGLIDLIREALAYHGVPGERLWLESTEAKVFTNLRTAQAFLNAASGLGCKVGLEQFGAGLDSFQLLAHFKPDFLKLDRSFTQDQASAAEHADHITEMTARSQQDGIATIAEHIQDAATMSLLFNSGIDYVQGNFVGAAARGMTFEFG
ncbi:MAG: EAL domain-containing protein [Pseudoxanthomonas sp.]